MLETGSWQFFVFMCSTLALKSILQLLHVSKQQWLSPVCNVKQFCPVRVEFHVSGLYQSWIKLDSFWSLGLLIFKGAQVHIGVYIYFSMAEFEKL
jgi:hypothetical protein